MPSIFGHCIHHITHHPLDPRENMNPRVLRGVVRATSHFLLRSGGVPQKRACCCVPTALRSSDPVSGRLWGSGQKAVIIYFSEFGGPSTRKGFSDRTNHTSAGSPHQAVQSPPAGHRTGHRYCGLPVTDGHDQGNAKGAAVE